MTVLTKAEEQVMHYLWNLKKAFLKDIVAEFPEPKPAYTTISTVVGVLVKKGFIAFETFGKVRRYHPTITKDAYFKKHMNAMVKSFFNGSKSKFASFFAQDENLNLSELEEIKQLIEEKIKKMKQDGE